MPVIPDPQIIRSRRSSIAISFTRDGELVVNAPLFAPNFMIMQFVNSKKDWIEKTYKKIHARVPKLKEYQDGEEFLFEGIIRKLRFYDGIEIAVRSDELLFPNALKFRISKELNDWYIKKAKERITQRVEYYAKLMDKNYKSIMFSDTKSKWGTCGPDNSLQFNWRLIMTPLMVIDYVVIHELSHTKHKNHSANFWKEVGKYTPAFRQHRKWLNNNAHLLQI